MKNVFRGASGAALLLGLGGLNGAWAQQGQTVAPTNPAPQTAQAPQTAPADQTTAPAAADAGERVIVTGSLIATLPEDAPKPVEVYTAQQLKEQGQPSVSEFVRSLTVNYGADLGFGQTSQDVPTGSGFANADLRGLGPNGTLVLMNGRRLASTNGGFGADLNTIPAEALEAVEVLKDGASTTYGAGAVGGVLNFRTRRDIDAPIISIEKTMYDGSEGEINADFQTGWVGDAGNILLSFHYGHVSPMSQLKRDFSSQPFNVNPSVYSLNAPNPGRFHPSTAFLTTPVVSGAVNDLPGSVGPAATQACQQIGGDIVTNLNGAPITTGSNTACALKQFYFQELVSENDNYRFYGEMNTDISDTMEATLNFTYSKSETLRNDIPTLAPINRAADAAVSALTCASSCQFVIPVQVQTYTTAGVGTGVFTANPFIADFMARTGVSAAALPTTGAVYTAANWRPFGYGGINGDYRKESYQRERILVTAGLNGEFSGDTLLGQWLGGIKYDYSAQFNQYLQTDRRPDVVVSRLQNALLGYGGPNCQVADRVATDVTSGATYNRTIGIQSDVRPGTNGCQWFNPFASGWSTSLATGMANPMFNTGAPTLVTGSTPRPTGYANPQDLVDWLLMDRVFETQYQSSTFDATWSGEIPGLELPGGSIGWAAGTQWRMTERRNISVGENQTERTLNLQNCPLPDPGATNPPGQLAPTPGSRGCSTTIVGAFFGTGRHVESYEDSQTLSYYAEFSFPVLDSLNLSASFRREDYNGGKVIGDIWSVAGKYDVTDNLYVRASYGTNFRAEQALDFDPGLITVDTETPTRFGSAVNVARATVIDPNLGPEDDTTFNAGVGYNMDLGDGRLRLSADFFEITVDGEVTTTGTATVYNNVFGLNSNTAVGGQTNRGVAGIPNTGAQNSINQFANCNASLISFLQFSSPCVQGVTTAASLVGSLRSTQNGPKRVMNGIDYSVDFTHPLFDGNFGVNVTATQNLVYKTQGYDVFGIEFEAPQDRLGYVNGSLEVPLVSDWRTNATVRWSNDEHSINLRANFQKGVLDERDPALIGTGIYPSAGTLTNIDQLGTVSMYGVKPKDYLDFDLNYIYTAPFWEELELRLSVLNLTDEDPLPTQGRNGYLTGIGNPRGRQVELGVTKRF